MTTTPGRVSGQAQAQRSFEANLAAARLGRVLDPRSPLPTPPDQDGRAVAVVALLGERLGFETRAVTIDEDAPVLEQARRLVEACQVRVRAVSLDDGWWTRNVPPLLVMYAGTLALVLPGPMFRPRLWRPEHDPVPVTAQVAADISIRAYEVIRPLPTGRSDLVSLMKVAVAGAGRDGFYAVAMSVLLGVVSLAVPIATAVIFSSIVPAGDESRLLAIGIALIALATAGAMFTYVRVYQLIRLSDVVETASSAAILDRVLRLPASRLRAWPSAELANRIMVNGPITIAIDQVVAVGLLSVVLVTLNGSLMMVLSPPLGLVAVGGGIVLIIVTIVLSRIEGRRVARTLQARDEVDDVTLGVLRGWVPVRLSAGDVSAFGRWAQGYSRYRAEFNRRWDIEIAIEIARVAIIGIAIIGIVVVAYAVPNGTIDSATFLAITSAYGIFSAGLIGLVSSIRAGVRAVPEIRRVSPLLGSEPEAAERHEDPGTLSGAIEVRRVSFRYGDDLPWILRDVSFHVPAGSSIAVVGTSGSGKSTLLRLLLGFEEPRNGAIFYDDSDLAALDLTAVRRQFGVVLQASLLLPGTIRDNLVVSSGPIGDTRLWEILQEVGLQEWVGSLPLGLDTTIDEGATILSGGQRQRLLLARAIAGDPRVLFLDEATSALDNLTQAAVTDTISRLGMTRVIIAHRLSTVQDADQIVVLDQGRIVESGDYGSLTAADGIFAELVRRQEL